MSNRPQRNVKATGLTFFYARTAVVLDFESQILRPVLPSVIHLHVAGLAPCHVNPDQVAGIHVLHRHSRLGVQAI